MDLTFVLLSAALFSLVLSDSLLVSGHTLSPGLALILKVLAITVVITGVLIAGWHRYSASTERVIGTFALMTLLVLLFSRGGPFSTVLGSGEPTPDLFWPIATLFVLSVTILF